MIFITAKFRVRPEDVEAFRDDAAGGAHVQSAHFRAAQESSPAHLVSTPQIVNFSLPQDDWSLLGEMAVAVTAEQP